MAIRQGQVEDLTERLNRANTAKALCAAQKTGLKASIADQNQATQKAAERARQLRERQAQARAQAQEAQQEAEEAIAELRAEAVRAQTCEQARQALIEEATGHVF
mgnify:CR=1 FL=1